MFRKHPPDMTWKKPQVKITAGPPCLVDVPPKDNASPDHITPAVHAVKRKLGQKEVLW